MCDYKNLDIDRLHETIEAIRNHEGTNRGQGRTTAFIVLMAHEIIAGDPNSVYVYVGENWSYSQQVCRLLAQYVETIYDKNLLTAFKPSVPEICTIMNQSFRFVSSESEMYMFRGMYISRAFVDVYDYEKRGRTLANLYPCVNGRGGDLVY